MAVGELVADESCEHPKTVSGHAIPSEKILSKTAPSVGAGMTDLRPKIPDDSSDDELESLRLECVKKIASQLNDPDSSSEEEIGQKVVKLKRTKKLFQDSDEESDVDDRPIVDKSLQKEFGSSSSGDDRKSDSDSGKSERASKKSDSQRKENRSDSELSSCEDASDVEYSIEAIKSKILDKHKASKSILITDSDKGISEMKRKTKSAKEKAPSRKAKEAALAEIHSETHRMVRERKVSLPYHVPKQRTLADFLNRRKFAPVARLKTSSEELEKVLNHVEERAKTAELFYKSESEDDVDAKDEQNLQEICEQSKSSPETTAALSNADESTSHPSDVTYSSAFQVEDSEEFPRLQLSEILANSESARMPESFDLTPNVVETLNTPLDDAIDGSIVDLNRDTITSKCENDPIQANVVPSAESQQLTDSETLRLNENNLSFSSLSEKINSLNLPIAKCPKISGAPDGVIDLDELSTKPGAFGLMQRFMKHAKLRPKVKKDDSIVSVISSELNDSGEVVGVIEEKIKVNSKKDEPKPGEKLVVLKTTLQQKMAVVREQQFAKKLEEYKLYEEEFYGELQNDEEEDIEDELLLENDDCKKKDDDEDDVGESNRNEFADEQAEEVNADDGEDDVDETASVLLGGNSEDEEEDTTHKQDDSSSEESEGEGDDFLPTPHIPTGLSDLAGIQNDGESLSGSQLMSLCSGNFSTANVNLKTLETESEAQAMKQFEDECESEPLPLSNIVRDLNTDDDDDDILTTRKSQKKRNRKLSFSDDEEETNDRGNAVDNNVVMETVDGTVDDQFENSENEKDVEGEEENENGSDIESEEEESNLEADEDEDDEEVQLAKKLSKGFLEKEAELSESEWGSEDEDEKGLDHYEEEEGDKDRISQRRLQKELGKIHMREIQAEDNREIKILQELLLEDGELHSDGPKRQRLFRWSNQDDDNRSDRGNIDLENGNDNGDDEDEESWRRGRLERENFLRQKKIDLHIEVAESPVSFSDTRKGVKVIPKIIPASKTSPDTKSPMSIFGKRGSFLSRGDKMLSKLAEITNSGSKENASGNSRSNRNMVFSVMSPPKEQPMTEPSCAKVIKRKADFGATSVVKKIKFSNAGNTNKISILEQLKVFEST